MNTKLALLGTPIIQQANQPINLPTKAIVMLGYLVIKRTPQRRDSVLAQLWPDSADEAARKNGRNTLWTIRKALNANVIQTRDDQLSLHPELEVDLWRWEQLLPHQPQAAMRLYRGPFLDGIQLNDAPDLDLWLMLERERLAQLHMRTLSELIQHHEQAERWAEIRSLAQQALQLDPLQEPIHRALMIAHTQLGDRHEALRQYELLTTILERELGVEPLPETIAIASHIRQGDYQRATPLSDHTNLHIEEAPQTPRGAAPFIGRLDETRLLDQAWAAINSGPRIALLTGETGVGKTRLMSEWRKQLPVQTTIFWMRCLQSIQHLPWTPLLEILQTQACLATIFNPAGTLSSIWQAELSRVLPQAHEQLPSLPTPPQLPADEERRRIFEAFVQVFQALTPPIVLFIDDLHWLDATTAAWLDYAVERMSQRPFLIVASYRAEEAAPTLHNLVASWSRRGLLQRIPLRLLTPTESTLLLQRLGNHTPHSEHVVAQSGGNPLFLIESSQSGDGSIPQALVDLIATRLERLPGAAQQIVQAAAVLNPEFTLDTLRQTSGRSEEETLDGIDALIEAHILQEDADQLTFAHPLIANVVETHLSTARRRFLHRRAAHSREQKYGPQIEALAGRLVDHYRIAGDPFRAAEYADLAAKHAQTLGATTEALEFRKTALELASSPLRQRALGQVLLWLGHIPNAQKAFQSALDAFEAGQLWHEIARTSLIMAESYLPMAAADTAIKLAEHAKKALIHCSDASLDIQVELLLATSRRMAGQPLKLAEQHVQQASALAQRHHKTEFLARIEFERGNQLIQQGKLDQAIAAFQRSLQQSQSGRDLFQEVLCHNNLAFAAILADQRELARWHIEHALEVAEMWSLRLPHQYLWSTRGELALLDGDPATAEIWFLRGLQAAEEQQNVVQVANYHANLALVAHRQHKTTRALHLLTQARTALEEISAPFLKAQIALWKTEILMEQGQRQPAYDLWSQTRKQLENSEQGYLQQRVEQLDSIYGFTGNLTKH